MNRQAKVAWTKSVEEQLAFACYIVDPALVQHVLDECACVEKFIHQSVQMTIRSGMCTQMWQLAPNNCAHPHKEQTRSGTALAWALFTPSLTPKSVTRQSLVVRLLLNAKTDVGHPQHGELLLLPRAEPVARLLLDARCDPNARHRREGTTAIMLALARRNLELVRTLLEYHADVYVQDKDGDNAIDSVFEQLDRPLQQLVRETLTLQWSSLLSRFLTRDPSGMVIRYALP
jgi:hypothetical protein